MDKATWVLDALTFWLVIVAIGALIASWRSARASNKSAAAATKLFELEQAEYRRREEAERPNLQLYHVYLKKPDQHTSATGMFNLPVHIDLMNFGVRPAKVTGARLEVAGKPFDADPRTTVCVRHHEIVRLTVNRLSSVDIREAFIEATTGVKPQLQGESESFLQRASNPENISDEYRKATVALAYSETDDSAHYTALLRFDVPTYRGDWSGKALTMRVLHDPNEVERGDLPG